MPSMKSLGGRKVSPPSSFFCYGSWWVGFSHVGLRVRAYVNGVMTVVAGGALLGCGQPWCDLSMSSLHG